MYNNIMFWVFCQYKFFQQWGKLREYANSKGIQLIGDVPFYVGKDSVDTWMHPEQFLLDENGEAAYVQLQFRISFPKQVRYGEIHCITGLSCRRMGFPGGNEEWRSVQSSLM